MKDYTITNEEIDAAWFGSWGDNPNKREIIAESLLKLAGGYATGYTALCILRELGLAGKSNLTKKGKRVMFDMNYTRTQPPQQGGDVGEVDVESLKKSVKRLVSAEQADYCLRSNGDIINFVIDHLHANGHLSPAPRNEHIEGLQEALADNFKIHIKNNYVGRFNKLPMDTLKEAAQAYAANMEDKS